MGHLLGYARVSTTDQQPHLQVDALTAAGCYRVFTETASGARTDRPTLEQLLDQLRPGRHPGGLEAGPARPLAAPPGRHRHRPRRARRRVPQPAGAGRHQHPGRQAGLSCVAALAEFERDLVRERTSAGLAAARARGRRGGRPSVLTGHKLQVAQEMYRSGQYTVAAIAKTLGVSRASIYRHLPRVGG
jgi:DNA invertase Pin-like site-specific DNA recombinase